MSSPVAQSVRDRRLNRMRETGEEYQVLLTRFALERLLYRLTQLPEGEGFVLKGAFTFLVWERTLGRQTRDLDLLGSDLLGSGPPQAERLREIFLCACRADVPTDGTEFDEESLQIGPIREEAEYDGLRAKLSAYIGSAHLRLQIDVGFGDATVPEPERRTFPGLLLLDFPEPEIKTYRPRTVLQDGCRRETPRDGAIRAGQYPNERLLRHLANWQRHGADVRSAHLGHSSNVPPAGNGAACRDASRAHGILCRGAGKGPSMERIHWSGWW